VSRYVPQSGNLHGSAVLIPLPAGQALSGSQSQSLRDANITGNGPVSCRAYRATLLFPQPLRQQQ
jgi:hypothetical protein